MMSNTDVTETRCDQADLFRLASLHAHFRKKIRGNIQELEEEQAQIRKQREWFEHVSALAMLSQYVMSLSVMSVSVMSPPART
eukprot:1846604-Rhodomonas_salina.2